MAQDDDMDTRNADTGMQGEDIDPTTRDNRQEDLLEDMDEWS